MFSSGLDRAQHPLLSRCRGILLGSALMLAIAASLVSPRTLAFTYWIIAVGFLLAAVVQQYADLRLRRPGPVALSLGAFLLYALLSAAWAIRPDIALTKASLALAIGASTLLIVRLIRNETRPNLLHIGEGVSIGLFVGLLYLLIELLTDQGIKIWLFRVLELAPGDLNHPNFFTWDGTRLLRISKDYLARNMAPAAIFLWPTVMMIRGAWEGGWRRAGAIFLVLLTATVVMMSAHESSKLTFVAGLGAFGLAHASPYWVRRLAIVVWVFACLAVVPAVLLAHRLDLHKSPMLQQSARHRIVIWNFTAEKIPQSPWIGTGANMTYVLGPELDSKAARTPRKSLKATLSTHSHSVYLQTWFELGLVGATLLTLVGLSILNAVRSLNPLVQPYAFATFASAAAMAATSYGMWQLWFMALFGLCAVLFSVGARLLARDTNVCPRSLKAAVVVPGLLPRTDAS